jgi:hypothetical protein
VVSCVWELRGEDGGGFREQLCCCYEGYHARNRKARVHGNGMKIETALYAFGGNHWKAIV